MADTNTVFFHSEENNEAVLDGIRNRLPYRRNVGVIFYGISDRGFVRPANERFRARLRQARKAEPESACAVILF